MKNIKIVMAAGLLSVFTISCSKDDVPAPVMNTVDPFEGTFILEDQMGRPAVNTVFVSSGSKDLFNVTAPSKQVAAFQSMFQTNLMALSPAFAKTGDKNALGQDAKAFTTLLATDVLNVSLDGKTTFYDGNPDNTLSGRALADDVITVELLLIFGGEDFSENPTLSDDHVSKNDKEFLTSFPYLAKPW